MAIHSDNFITACLKFGHFIIKFKDATTFLQKKKKLSQNTVLYFIQIYVCRFTYLFMASEYAYMYICIHTEAHVCQFYETQALVTPTPIIYVYAGGPKAVFSLSELKQMTQY